MAELATVKVESVYGESNVTNIVKITQLSFWVCQIIGQSCRRSHPRHLTYKANHHLWWTGPPWLFLPASNWPSKSPKTDGSTDTCAQRSTCGVNNAVAEQSNELIERYAKLTRLVRIAAYCRRFIFNTRCDAKSRKTSPINGSELRAALQLCKGSIIHSAVTSNASES